MSVFDGSFWADGVWDASLWENGVFDTVNPIVELFARLNGTGVAVDPLNAAKVFSDTAGTTLVTLNGTVARVDSTAGVAASFTNGTAGQQPLLRADGLEFDGVDDRLIATDIPELRFGTTDFTIAFACTPDVVTGAHGIFSKRGTGASGTNPGWGLRQNGTDLQLEYDHPSNTIAPNQIVAAGVFAVGVPQYGLARIDRTAGTATARIGGVEKAPVSLNIGDISSGNFLTIGAEPTNVFFFDGKVGRLLAIDKLLNPADTATVEQWLQNLI